jgi:hypothetical protein
MRTNRITTAASLLAVRLLATKSGLPSSSRDYAYYRSAEAIMEGANAIAFM